MEARCAMQGPSSKRVVSLTRRLHRDRRGVTAIEYGLLASLIAIVIVFGAYWTGRQLDCIFRTVAYHLGAPIDEPRCSLRFPEPPNFSFQGVLGGGGGGLGGPLGSGLGSGGSGTGNGASGSSGVIGAGTGNGSGSGGSGAGNGASGSGGIVDAGTGNVQQTTQAEVAQQKETLIRGR